MTDSPSPSTGAERLQAEAAKELGSERKLAWGATLSIVGLGIVGTRASEPGGALSLVGWLLLFWAIHRYGRLGPPTSAPQKGTTP